MTRTLKVYLNKKYVGNLIEENGNILSFQYDKSAENPISLSMPISKDRYGSKIVRPFFENLLPEGDVIKEISKIYRVSESNPFSLLNVIGEDCAGAIHLTNEEFDENIYIEPIVISKNEFEKLLNEYMKGSAYYKKGMRLSLAGVQNKTTILKKNEKVFYPNFHNPSSHILKFEYLTNEKIVINEFFSTKLAKSLGLNVSNIELKNVNQSFYLEIERFDRDNKGIRIHQEDFCQLLSIRPSNKYQNEGGPSFRRIVEFMKINLNNPSRDTIDLAKIMVFNYLIGNCDYHGKNISVIYKDKTQLTPFYDLISTRIYNEFSNEMAMSIDKIYNFDKIEKYNIINELNSWGINGEKILKLILNDFSKIIDNAHKIKSKICLESLEIDLIINLIKAQLLKLI